MNNVELAKKWLLNSGIQNASSDGKIDGGFNSWYDIDKKQYPFIYSETTGYGITTLLYMNQTMKSDVLMSKAKAAAKWLLSNAYHECGGFKTRYFLTGENRGSFGNQNIHTFDVGIILHGIVNLFKATNNKAYLDTAKKVADFLLKCQKQDGLFHAIYDPENDKYVDTREKWSTQSGGFHAKIALAMTELFLLTKDDSYRNSAKRICDATLGLQNSNGSFTTFAEGGTHLHPHFYSTEGLFYTGTKLNEKKYVSSALKACKWALDNQMDNGGIPFLYTREGRFTEYERTDILAQALRMGCIFYNSGELGKDYAAKLAKLKTRLCEFQFLNKAAAAQNGGFLFGADFDGKKLNNANSWCSMFALQALDIYEKTIEKGAKAVIDILI